MASLLFMLPIIFFYQVISYVSLILQMLGAGVHWDGEMQADRAVDRLRRGIVLRA